MYYSCRSTGNGAADAERGCIRGAAAEPSRLQLWQLQMHKLACADERASQGFKGFPCPLKQNMHLHRIVFVVTFINALQIIVRALPLVPPAPRQRQALIKLALLCMGSLIRVLRVFPPPLIEYVCVIMCHTLPTTMDALLCRYCRADGVPSFAVLQRRGLQGPHVDKW